MDNNQKEQYRIQVENKFEEYLDSFDNINVYNKIDKLQIWFNTNIILNDDRNWIQFKNNIGNMISHLRYYNRRSLSNQITDANNNENIIFTAHRDIGIHFNNLMYGVTNYDGSVEQFIINFINSEL